MHLTAQLHQPARAGTAPPAAASARAPVALAPQNPRRAVPQRQGARRAAVAAAAAAAPAAPDRQGGHTALLHGLGEVGDVPAVHMPWLLRLAHIKSRTTGGDSTVALQESARGLLMWKVRGAGVAASWNRGNTCQQAVPQCSWELPSRPWPTEGLCSCSLGLPRGAGAA